MAEDQQDELDIFIDEMEEIAKELARRRPTLKDGPKGIENLCRLSCAFYTGQRQKRIIELLEDIEANTEDIK